MLITKGRKVYPTSTGEIFFKLVHIWQSYMQERGCLVHFVCLANTLLKVHLTAMFLLVNLQNIQQFKIFCTDRLKDKTCLI